MSETFKSSGLGSPAWWRLILGHCFPLNPMWPVSSAPSPRPSWGSQRPYPRGGRLPLQVAQLPQDEQALNADCALGMWVLSSVYSHCCGLRGRPVRLSIKPPPFLHQREVLLPPCPCHAAPILSTYFLLPSVSCVLACSLPPPRALSASPALGPGFIHYCALSTWHSTWCFIDSF